MSLTGTLRRGSTSVDFELYQEGPGNLAIARDVGKPNQKERRVSAINPRIADDWSSVETWTVLGMFLGTDAYGRATRIVEDLVKPHSGGTPLILDLTGVPGFDTAVEVGVPLQRAVELDYQPGIKNRVDLQLSVPLVNDTLG